MNVPSRRYLAVWLRRLPTDRIATTFAPGEPLVVAAPVKSALRLAAVNDAAAKLGLRVGMPLADARAMYPRINVADADEAADLRLLEAVADWCDRYTPLVGLDAPDGLMLDISGCAHLFGGEAALAGDLVRRLGARGLQVRVAVAGTVGCAWGVARYMTPTRRTACVDLPLSGGGIGETVVSSKEREALSPLPLAALRVSPSTLESLAKVGLKHIADVLDLPRAPLAARFGQAFVRRLDQALGIEDEPITPRLPVPAALAEQRFPEPIARESDVLGTIETLAGRIGRVLEARGEGARLLQAALFRADGKVFRVEAGTGAPLHDAARIAKLFAERLAVISDEFDPGFGFDMIRLSALATERSDPRQTGLAAPDHEVELAHLIDRLGARFGLRRVTRLVPQDTHIPEYAVMAVSAHMVRRPSGRTSLAVALYEDVLAPTRPIHLLTDPEPIKVIAELPDGPPAQFTWRQMRYAVLRAEGPERIAMEWWRDRSGLVLMRDYFRVESREGMRAWIFREWLKLKTQEDKERESEQKEDWYLGQEIDQQPLRWLLHGVFA
jgi:protein ImuB